MTTATIRDAADVNAIIDSYLVSKERSDASGARGCQQFRDFIAHRERVIRPALNDLVARLRVGGFPCMLHQSTAKGETPSITFSALGRSITFRAHEIFGAQVVGGPWGEDLARDTPLESLTSECIRAFATQVASQAVR